LTPSLELKAQNKNFPENIINLSVQRIVAATFVEQNGRWNIMEWRLHAEMAGLQMFFSVHSRALLQRSRDNPPVLHTWANIAGYRRTLYST